MKFQAKKYMLFFEQKIMTVFMRKASATQPLSWDWEMTQHCPVKTAIQLPGLVRQHLS